jgi:rhodanese-related sulfurtransferase
VPWIVSRADTEPVDRDELLHRVKLGQITVLDVCSAQEYAAGHIPGALSHPSRPARRPDR